MGISQQNNTQPEQNILNLEYGFDRRRGSSIFGMRKQFFLVTLLLAFLLKANVHFGQIKLDSGWHHLRNADPREWSEFPEKASLTKLSLPFTSAKNAGEQTLSLRQYDVKQNWRVVLNGKQLGSLVSDEKDLMAYLTIPPGVLQANNVLEIGTEATEPDDVRVGKIVLYERPLNSVLTEAHVSIEIRDQEQQLIPGRITIVDAQGILQSVTGLYADPLAVRAGHVYTGNGKATLGLPAGIYTLYAGRGFEYGIDSARIELKAGEHAAQTFSISREVSTTGWVSSDTHIHTYTFSRHGDASASERVLTIAGEGIELPVMTDHNQHIDLRPFAIDQGVERFFTPVMGNEVTTAIGHFNVFPVLAGQTVVTARAETWKTLSENLGTDAGAQAIILNHARDIHVKFRPFDPEKHLSVAGMRLDKWKLPANAMEVINSGSQQTDPLELTRDWFGMLNHGEFLTPAGSSDSHDVSRFIVGQARTYIRCNDDNPGKINVQEAVSNFLAGNVMVSFGLLAEIEINDSYGPGELAPASDAVKVSLKVSGPAWTHADRIELYANGKKIREENIAKDRVAGTKWSGEWDLTLPTHDIFLVALAFGAGEQKPFWPIAKPFQPTSPDWSPAFLGLSGAVWLDGDRNGKRNSAFDYAQRLYTQSRGDIQALIKNLSAFDQAVATQVAAILHQSGKDLNAADITKALRKATPETKAAFAIVISELSARE